MSEDYMHLMIVADTGGLPAAIVATGITLVQLEPIVGVPAHVQNGDSERTLACMEEEDMVG